MTVNTGWHKRVLVENAKSIVTDGITYVIIVLVFLAWRFALGFEFEWHQIAPLSEPSIFVRSFYSAFTFVTLGALLYFLKFYKVLHDILVKGMGLWGFYNAIKAVVWLGLMYVSYAYLVPWLFAALNAGASVLFNLANLALYAAPPIGIGVVLATVAILVRGKIQSTKSSHD